MREISKPVWPFSQCVKDIRNGRGGILFNTDQVLPHVRNPLSALDILANSLTPTGGLSLSFHSKLVDGDLEKKKNMKIFQVWKSWYLPNATTDEIGQQGGTQSGGEGDNATNKQTSKTKKLTNEQTNNKLTYRNADAVDQQAR